MPRGDTDQEYQAEVAELSANCGSAERRNAAMAEDLRLARGWRALYEIEMRKLEEESEAEVKVSAGCAPDERIDDVVEPCEVDPEELRHYVALQRQYHYLGIDDLRKIPGFSGVLRRTRLRSPRGLAESFKTQTEEAKAKEAVETCVASVQTDAMDHSDAQMGELVATKEGVEKQKAAEDVVTNAAAAQTYGNVVEFATKTEDGDDLELKGHASTFRREENGGNVEFLFQRLKKGHVPALKQSTAEPETVRDVEQDKYLGVDYWICKYERCVGDGKWRNMAFETTCTGCGAYRGYKPAKLRKSKSCVRQRGRGSHRPRGRGI